VAPTPGPGHTRVLGTQLPLAVPGTPQNASITPPSKGSIRLTRQVGPALAVHIEVHEHLLPPSPAESSQCMGLQPASS
jgi:hypothetical protein